MFYVLFPIIEYHSPDNSKITHYILFFYFIVGSTKNIHEKLEPSLLTLYRAGYKYGRN